MHGIGLGCSPPPEALGAGRWEAGAPSLSVPMAMSPPSLPTPVSTPSVPMSTHYLGPGPRSLRGQALSCSTPAKLQFFPDALTWLIFWQRWCCLRPEKDPLIPRKLSYSRAAASGFMSVFLSHIRTLPCLQCGDRAGAAYAAEVTAQGGEAPAGDAELPVQEQRDTGKDPARGRAGNS